MNENRERENIPGKGDKSHPIPLVRVRLPASVRGVSVNYGRS